MARTAERHGCYRPEHRMGSYIPRTAETKGMCGGERGKKAGEVGWGPSGAVF